MQFRMIVDKEDQGRALIMNNVLKDSNNEISADLQHHGNRRGNLHGADRGAAAARRSDSRRLDDPRGD